jgi:phosphomevalonate kinase
VKPFSLPKGLEILVGDVSGGSSTVSMVRKVLEWKKNEPDESTYLINNLNICNQKVAHEFESLRQVLKDDTMKDILHRLGETTSEKVRDNIHLVFQLYH